MGRAILIIGAGAALIGIIIYALIDCVRTPASQARSLPKPAWLAIILLFPVVGALLWLFVGRPRTGGSASLGSRGASSQTFKAPDDDEEYLRFLNAKAKRQRASQENQRTQVQQRPDRQKESSHPSSPRDQREHSTYDMDASTSEDDPTDHPDTDHLSS